MAIGTVENADGALTRAQLAIHGLSWMLMRTDAVRRELKSFAITDPIVCEGSYRLTLGIVEHASAKLVALYEECLEWFDSLEAEEEDYDFLETTSGLIQKSLNQLH